MSEGGAPQTFRQKFNRYANYTVGIVLLLFLGAIFLDPLLFLLGFKEGEVRELAGRIHRECQSASGCPATIDGWQLRENGHSVRGNFIYVPGYRGSGLPAETAAPYTRFLLASHFGPDWRYEASGGPGRDLQVVRIVD